MGGDATGVVAWRTAGISVDGLFISLDIVENLGRAHSKLHRWIGQESLVLQSAEVLKRRDLEAMIEAALVSMRTALRSRGVRAVADVI